MVGKSVKFYFFDSFFIAALILCVIFYSGILSVKSQYGILSLNSDFGSSKEKVYGKLVSSPIKVSGMDSYKVNMEIYALEKENGAFFQCKGKVSALLPANQVEAFYPGKLFSESKMEVDQVPLLDEGQELCVYGSFSQKKDFFYGKKISCFEENSLTDFEKNVILKNTEKNPLSKAIYSFRSLSRLKFRRLMYSWGKAGSLFLALMCGIKDYLDEDVAAKFRIAGLSHILALSGMHLSLFSALSLKAGKVFFGKKIAFIFQLIAIISFVWFAGISPSLFRALLCSLIVIFAKLLNIPIKSLFQVLSITFLIHVSVFPYHIHEISFMLSYGSLVGIILFSNFWTARTILKFPFFLANSISSSVSAVSCTSFVTYFCMGTFSFIGIFSTTFVSPIVNLFIYSGIVLFIMSICFPFLLSYNAFFMQFMYNILNSMVGFFSSIVIR